MFVVRFTTKNNSFPSVVSLKPTITSGFHTTTRSFLEDDKDDRGAGRGRGRGNFNSSSLFGSQDRTATGTTTGATTGLGRGRGTTSFVPKAENLPRANNFEQQQEKPLVSSGRGQVEDRRISLGKPPGGGRGTPGGRGSGEFFNFVRQNRLDSKKPERSNSTSDRRTGTTGDRRTGGSSYSGSYNNNNNDRNRGRGRDQDSPFARAPVRLQYGPGIGPRFAQDGAIKSSKEDDEFAFEGEGQPDEAFDDELKRTEQSVKKDFDIEGFKQDNQYYDYLNPIQRFRIIYYGQTAETLDVQEKMYKIHSERQDMGWVLRKHTRLVERINKRKELEKLAQKMIDDDCSFVKYIDFDNDIVRRDPIFFQYKNQQGYSLDNHYEDTPKGRLVYLEGKTAFAPQFSQNTLNTPDEMLRAPGLLLQELPRNNTQLDLLKAFNIGQAIKKLEEEERIEKNACLTEGQISEYHIQRFLPNAIKQGVPEETLRTLAGALSANRYFTMKEKLRIFRTISRQGYPDPEKWMRKANSIYEF